MPDITLTFPDGAKRQVQRGTTGLDVAKSIAPSLAKRTVAMVLDGELHDVSEPIEKDAAVRFVSRTDAEALELIRHDCAHVLVHGAVDQLLDRHISGAWNLQEELWTLGNLELWLRIMIDGQDPEAAFDINQEAVACASSG